MGQASFVIFQAQSSGRIARGHADRFRQGGSHQLNHIFDAANHGGGAAGKDGIIRGHTDLIMDPAFDVCEVITCAFGESGSGAGVGDQSNAGRSFGLEKCPHESGRNMTAIGDQFAEDFRFAHGEFQESGDTVRTPAAGHRHAIVRMGDLAETMGKRRCTIFIPGITVPRAAPDSRLTEGGDQFQGPGQFGRNRDLGDGSGMRQPLGPFLTAGMANESQLVGPRFFRGEIGTLNMDSQHRRAWRGLLDERVNGIQNLENVFLGGRDGGEGEGGGSPTGMKATNLSKNFGVRLHGMVFEGPVNMEVNEAGSEKLAFEINCLLTVLGDDRVPEGDNFSFFEAQISLENAVGEDETGVLIKHNGIS